MGFPRSSAVDRGRRPFRSVRAARAEGGGNGAAALVPEVGGHRPGSPSPAVAPSGGRLLDLVERMPERSRPRLEQDEAMEVLDQLVAGAPRRGAVREAGDRPTAARWRTGDPEIGFAPVFTGNGTTFVTVGNEPRRLVDRWLEATGNAGAPVRPDPDNGAVYHADRLLRWDLRDVPVVLLTE